MKVININKYHQLTGGGDRFFFDTAKILEGNGHEAVPFCLSYPNNEPTPYARYFPEGIRGSDIHNQSISKKIKFFINGIYSFEAKHALEKLIDDTKPDLAHLHVLHFTMSPSVIDALRAKKIPIVFSLHDYRFACASGYLFTEGKPCQRCRGNRFYQAVRHRCYKNSVLPSLMATMGNYLYRLIGIYDKVDLFTVPHEEMAEIVQSFGLPKEKIRILRNPFWVDDDGSAAKTGDYVLFYGNLSAQKGTYTLAQAAKHNPAIPFVVCGDGPARKDFEMYLADNQITNVKLDTSTRWKSGLPALVKGARFVVSSSEWPAPMEYTTLEAMAFGKTVLASNIGGNRTVVKEGQTGFLFEQGNSQDLSAKIADLFRQPAVCESIGREAKKYIQTMFDSKVFYRELLTIYDEARTPTQ